MNKPVQIIMIDNFDSFTYNLVDQFRQLDLNVVIFRNDTPPEAIFTEERLSGFNNIIVLSPGPGNPDSAGNTLKIIAEYASKLPILGICLGHQSIIQNFGGTVGRAKNIVHGKADNINVEPHPVFEGIESNFRIARYHSLVATSMPSSLLCIGRTFSNSSEINPIESSESKSEPYNQNSEVMAIVHKEYKVIGFQFHPESILTTFGKKLLINTINWLTSKEKN